MKTTKLVCPKCGAEIAIPEHESFVAGIAIGKDSGLGTVTLPLADDNKSVGDIVTSLNTKDGVTAFPVNVDGDTKVGIVEDGEINIYETGDPIIDAILAAGTVPNYTLFRRNVLAQLMRAEKKGGIHQVLKSKGYEYMWKMFEEELRVQSRLFHHNDMDNFTERNLFFDKMLAIELACDYINKLRLYVDHSVTMTCRHRPYKRIGKYNVYLNEIESKIFSHLDKAILRIRKADSPISLYVAVHDFRKLPSLTVHNREVYNCVIKLPYDTEIPEAFVNAYKGVGGYAACKNMILFSGARVHKRINGHVAVLSERASLSALNECRERAILEGGYLLIGFWRELCKDNAWNFDAKFEQWKREKEARRKAKNARRI